MVLSIEERVFLVEYVFREGDIYTDLVQVLTLPTTFISAQRLSERRSAESVCE
jgi:hypothetical protein